MTGLAIIAGSVFGKFRRDPKVVLIENGEITEPLREGNIIGNGPQVLRDIDMLGNDFAMGNPGTCGKDGQGVPVGDGQPTLRVSALTIGGTAASHSTPGRPLPVVVRPM